MLLLSEYDMEVHYKPGGGMGHADALSKAFVAIPSKSM
jgi:hypothetical protein